MRELLSEMLETIDAELASIERTGPAYERGDISIAEYHMALAGLEPMERLRELVVKALERT